MATGPSIDELQFADAPDVEAVPGPRSRRLLREQDERESNAVLYPNDVPIALAEGRGATLRDVDGNTFLDFFAGIGVTNVGHSNPYVTEAAIEQTRTLTHTLDFPTEARRELVERLDDVVPDGLAGRNRVLFGGPTGSDAVEATIKLAKANTGGTGLIAFRGAYHGGTTGALSLTADTSEKHGFAPLLGDVQHVRYPDPVRRGVDPERAVEESLAEVEAVLSDRFAGLADPAGVWVEPIQGEHGVVVPPDGFLSGLRALTREHDVPLIVDEVQTGFGRTGRWFASEWEGVTPDVMPMAKAMGAGFPLAATVYDEELDVLEPGAHAGTFRGYLPAMRAAVRAIEYVEAHDLLAHARELGEYVLTRLEEAAGNAPRVADVRGRGLFVGATLVDDDGERAPDVAAEVQRRCYENGVIVWTGGNDAVVRLMPPLVLTRRQAERGMDVIVEAIEAAAGE